MPTLSELVNDAILKLNPLAKVEIAIFQAVSRAVVEEDAAVIYIMLQLSVLSISASTEANGTLGQR